jgi:hypothetical protein
MLPLWFALSLMAECDARVQEVFLRLSPEQMKTREAWDLTVATRASQMFTRGTRPEEYASWEKTTAEPETSSYPSPTISNILTLWTWNIRKPDYDEMMRLATRHAEHALVGQPTDRVMSDWVMGLSTHHIGQFQTAQAHLVRFLASETAENRQLFISHTEFDRNPAPKPCWK